jgi:hypothetical protein
LCGVILHQNGGGEVGLVARAVGRTDFCHPIVSELAKLLE